MVCRHIILRVFLLLLCCCFLSLPSIVWNRIFCSILSFLDFSYPIPFSFFFAFPFLPSFFSSRCRRSAQVGTLLSIALDFVFYSRTQSSLCVVVAVLGELQQCSRSVHVGSVAFPSRVVLSFTHIYLCMTCTPLPVIICL